MGLRKRGSYEVVLRCRNRVEHRRLLGLRLHGQVGVRGFLLGDDVR